MVAAKSRLARSSRTGSKDQDWNLAGAAGRFKENDLVR